MSVRSAFLDRHFHPAKLKAFTAQKGRQLKVLVSSNQRQLFPHRLSKVELEALSLPGLQLFRDSDDLSAQELEQEENKKKKNDDDNDDEGNLHKRRLPYLHPDRAIHPTGYRPHGKAYIDAKIQHTLSFVGVKDIFTTSNLPTTCASNILQGFKGPTATVVRLLQQHGHTIVAKTNMDEFGMGSHSTNSVYGPVRMWEKIQNSFSSGGSSGGSALAVAKGYVDIALGSDTGGSVRLPAAYTNTVGFKPSYGRLSRNGLIPYAHSLDTVGIIGKQVEEVLGAFDLLDKPDPNDPTCLTESTRRRIDKAIVERTSRVGGMGARQSSGYDFQNVTRRRIGVPIEYNIAELHPHVRQAWEQTLANLSDLGHEIVPVSLPTTKQALSAYYILAPAEASSNLAKYDGVKFGTERDLNTTDDATGVLYAAYRGQHFGDEVKRRILLGSFSLSAGAMDNYFIQAQKIRRLVQDDFDMVFRLANPLRNQSSYNHEGVDLIVCPTAPTAPPRLAEVMNASPLASYMNDVFTVPASLAGLPAISTPAPANKERPRFDEYAVGIQVIGQFGDDENVLSFAHHNLERLNDWTGARLPSRRKLR